MKSKEGAQIVKEVGENISSLVFLFLIYINACTPT